MHGETVKNRYLCLYPWWIEIHSVGKSRVYTVLDLEVHEVTAGLQRVMSGGQGDLLGAFEYAQFCVP